MRLFLSIPIPVDLSQATEPFMGEGFRPVPVDSWHMTVRFLGDADPKEVIAAMEGFRADAMQAHFSGAGAFPTPKKARVAWVGVHADGLGDVAAEVRDRVTDIGETDDKGFVPHVTLGRCKRPTDLRVELSEVEVPHGTFSLDRVSLMASILTPDGPEYTALRSWLL